MAHTHEVSDNDICLVIDGESRKIALPEGGISIMQYDHNSERVRFELPRYIDGHDMSQCNKVEVHYINISESGESKSGVYTCNDLEVGENEVATVSWLISANATQHAGKLCFLLRFACLTGSTIEYAWHTETCHGITVGSGMNNAEAILTEYSDVIEAWKEENTIAGVTASVESVEGGATITVTDKNGTTTAFLRDGKDGISATHSWDGTTLTVTSASGTSSADLKGENGTDGADGYTPVKGTDYWTAEDKAEILADLSIEATPDYIIAEAERVVNNIQTTRGAKSVVFPALSDFHLYIGNSSHNNSLLSTQYAGMGIDEIKKRIHLDFVGLLGDYSWMDTAYSATQVMKDIVGVKETTVPNNTEVWCVGNHDINYGKNRTDRILTNDELYGYIGANADGVKPYADLERCYGYIDFNNQKIRVIYLNTCDVSDWEVPEIGTEHAQSEWISPTQMQWLASEALNFTEKDSPSDWGIIIVGHHPLHYSKGCYAQALELLEAYRDGLSGTKSCTIRTETAEDGTTTYPQQAVTYDFSATERAKIICSIHGHTHNFSYSKISSTTWKEEPTTPVEPWLWRIAIPNTGVGRENSGYDNFSSSSFLANNYGEFEADGVTPKYWTKSVGTAKGTSFCVIDVNPSKEKISAYCFGAGLDRVIGYGAASDTEYDISISLSNCSASASNPVKITADGTAVLEFTAADEYNLPSAITVTGATYTWSRTNGTLTLSSPTNDVKIVIEGTTEVPTVNNLIPTSIDTDGSIYNGTGYAEGKYLSSSGSVSTRTGVTVTGFIPIGYGSAISARGEQVIYLQAIDALPTDGNFRIAFYDSAKTYLGLLIGTNLIAETADTGLAQSIYTLGSDGLIDKVDVTGTTAYYKTQNDVEATYFRISSPGLDGESVITVNEPIE